MAQVFHHPYKYILHPSRGAKENKKKDDKADDPKPQAW
jgi:hypothetical protein